MPQSEQQRRSKGSHPQDCMPASGFNRGGITNSTGAGNALSVGHCIRNKGPRCLQNRAYIQDKSATASTRPAGQRNAGRSLWNLDLWVCR